MAFLFLLAWLIHIFPPPVPYELWWVWPLVTCCAIMMAAEACAEFFLAVKFIFRLLTASMGRKG